MPRKPFPARPAKPFQLSGLQWHLDNVANHTRAGFEHVPDDHVRWHWVFFLQFLAEHGYLQSADQQKTELWSTDLTIEGYRFAQYAADRWLERLGKHDDEARGRKYLDKWHKAFKLLPSEAFEGAT